MSLFRSIEKLEAERDEIAERLEAHEARTAGELSDARLEDLDTLTAAYEPPLELDAGFDQSHNVRVRFPNRASEIGADAPGRDPSEQA